MDRRHLEDALAGQLVARHLDDHRQRFQHEQAADATVDARRESARRAVEVFEALRMIQHLRDERERAA